MFHLTTLTEVLSSKWSCPGLQAERQSLLLLPPPLDETFLRIRPLQAAARVNHPRHTASKR